MTKTTNYQLNQWAKPDRVMMDDFNADNAKIDAALKANADAIAAETTARVAGDVLVKLKEITVTSEIAQIDMNLSDIDLRSFSKLIIRPALACTDNGTIVCASAAAREPFSATTSTASLPTMTTPRASAPPGASTPRSSCAPATAATTSPPES